MQSLTKFDRSNEIRATGLYPISVFAHQIKLLHMQEASLNGSEITPALATTRALEKLFRSVAGISTDKKGADLLSEADLMLALRNGGLNRAIST